MATTSIKSVLLAASLLLAFGCGGSGGSGSEEPGGEGEETSGGEGEGEAEAGSYEGPITSTEVDRGKDIFSTHCDDCHPGGEEDVGPSLIADPHSPADLRKQVREGSGKMRPFSEKRINKDDLEALLAYLASINAVK